MAPTGLLRRPLRRSGFDLKHLEPLVDPNLQRQGVLESRGIGLVLDGGANRGRSAGRLRSHGGRIVSRELGAEAFALNRPGCHCERDATIRKGRAPRGSATSDSRSA